MLNWCLYFSIFQILCTCILIEQERKEPIIMDTFKTYQSIAYFYYSNPHHYMSLTELLKHMVEHNTWNTIHALLHLQVQGAA